MIDCQVTVDRKPDPKGDRVVLTFECVSLPLFLKRRADAIILAAGSSSSTHSGERQTIVYMLYFNVSIHPPNEILYLLCILLPVP